MIYINEVYKYVDKQDEYIRIIDVSDETDSFYYVILYTNISTPSLYKISSFINEINEKIVVKVPDPFFKIIDEDKLSDGVKTNREQDWAIVNQLWVTHKEALLSKSMRGKTMKAATIEYNISFTQVRRLLARFWQRGMNKNAMLLEYYNSGGKGKERTLGQANKVGRPKNVDYEGNNLEGINITPDIKKLFRLGIDKYYNTKEQLSLTEVYHAILKDYFSTQYIENGKKKYQIWDKKHIPTYGQFYYWFKKLEDPYKNIIARKGIKEYELKHRPILNTSISETIGPGSRFQVDATVADVYLVSKLDRNRIIGRPVVYAIIDVFSRLITGIYVGLEGPSWLGAMMALENMVTDKVEFCKQYGIDIAEGLWTAKHLPEAILADRGEFEGYSVENLISNLGIAVENTTSYRGDLKGIVERNFRTLNTKLKHKTPGAIMKEYRQRGDRDYRLDATLTLEEFTQIYIRIVLNHNNTTIDKYLLENQMVVENIPQIPAHLWKWGIENKKGALRTVDREVMRLNVLPKGRANVSRMGIKFKNLIYSSPKAIEEQWFISKKIRSIEIVYDPRNMEAIYIPEEDGRSYEACYLLEQSKQYKGMFLEEIVFLQELQAELKESQKQQELQYEVNLNNEIESIVKKAQKEKSKEVVLNNQSKTSKIRSIKKNREVEKEMNRVEEAFDLGQKDTVEKAQILELIPKQPEAKELIEKDMTSKQKLMDKLKQKRDEKRGK